MRSLIAAGENVAGAAVEIEAGRCVALRNVLMLEVQVGARGDIRRVGSAFRKSRDDRILPRAIRGRVVAERQALGRIEIARKENSSYDRNIALVLHFVGIDEAEQRVVDDGEAGGGAELTAVVLAVIERKLRRVARDVLRVLAITIDFAVESVRPLLGLHENDCAVSATEFCAVVVGQNLK